VSSLPTTAESGERAPIRAATPLYRRLYVQMLCAVAAGALLGYLRPELAQHMKPLGDVFIKLIRMMIEPIIFTTVVVGIAKMGDMKEVGRVGLKALIYFEAVSAIALLMGLIVTHLYRPGAGLEIDWASLDRTAVTSPGASFSAAGFAAHMVPDTLVGAFAGGQTLQVVLISVLFGLAVSTLGPRVRPMIDLLDQAAQALFRVIGLIMIIAPLGAFGAMAFTIGKYGIGTLQQLGLLLIGVYTTCLAFVFLVLGLIARCAGFSIWRFLRYIREELLIVFGTSTSESALPGLMLKLEALGCERAVVGLVVPTGYSFNLDGTSIYLSTAILFIAQAAHIHLSWRQQIEIFGLLLLTSKGSAAMTGGGFITLAATLSSLKSLPIAGLALLFGVDRFMSEARAITNLIGNGVATIVVASWEGAINRECLRRELSTSRSHRVIARLSARVRALRS
jgi:aerobic C4-dicarboxylate transport protein